jgi:hypothetical protein
LEELKLRNLRAREITEQRLKKQEKEFRNLKPDTESLLESIRIIESKYNMA